VLEQQQQQQQHKPKYTVSHTLLVYLLSHSTEEEKAKGRRGSCLSVALTPRLGGFCSDQSSTTSTHVVMRNRRRRKADRPLHYELERERAAKCQSKPSCLLCDRAFLLSFFFFPTVLLCYYIFYRGHSVNNPPFSCQLLLLLRLFPWATQQGPDACAAKESDGARDPLDGHEDAQRCCHVVVVVFVCEASISGSRGRTVDQFVTVLINQSIPIQARTRHDVVFSFPFPFPFPFPSSYRPRGC
jgi:hypothetical protein